MKLLEGKTVIITGASRGIGKGIVELFVQHGANIAFTYHSSEKKARILEENLSVNDCKVKVVWSAMLSPNSSKCKKKM